MELRLLILPSILLLAKHSVRARYFATFCITSGTYTTIGITIAWRKFSTRLTEFAN
jgi:hypothetical protein